MSSLVLLRWILPVGGPDASARDLISARISPAVRASGWLSSPGTTHDVSDQGAEAWLTVITPLDDVTDVQEELNELLMSRPAVAVHGSCERSVQMAPMVMSYGTSTAPLITRLWRRSPLDGP